MRAIVRISASTAARRLFAVLAALVCLIGGPWIGGPWIGGPWIGGPWIGREVRADSGVAIGTPIGWSTRDPDRRARTRVSTWLADRTDARIASVLTPGTADDFAEVLAVVELDGPYDPRATEAAELERALARLLPYDASTAELAVEAATSERPGIVRARWVTAAIAYRVALVPAGNQRAVVVLATLANEMPLYERAFDEALAGLGGARAPVLPFAHGRWRVLMLLGWLVPAALLLGLALWRRPFAISHIWIGRGLALAFVAAALVVGAIVHARMVERTAELGQAGLSPETLTAEAVTYGIAIAVVCWIVGTVLARRDRPVESAPTTGVFAGRSPSSSQVQIPIVPRVPPSLRRHHPDGPSTLHPATDPPGGTLRPIDPGREPRDID